MIGREAGPACSSPSPEAPHCACALLPVHEGEHGCPGVPDEHEAHTWQDAHGA